MGGPVGQAGAPQQRASPRLAFLGPAGTFSEQAALKYDAGAEQVPMASITAVASAVDSGMADLGIVPIENSLEGAFCAIGCVPGERRGARRIRGGATAHAGYP